MRQKTEVSVSVGAVLLLSALWFFFDTVTFLALLAAALIHETGHLAALSFFGCRIAGFRADMSGAMICGAGSLTPMEELCSLAAGPALGMIYALMASAAGNALGSSFLLRSAGISLLLSVFNLLPTQPLDGGRLLAILWDNPRACAAISFAVSFLLLGCGLFLMAKGMGLGLFIAGIWLMIAQAAL